MRLCSRVENHVQSWSGCEEPYSRLRFNVFCLYAICFEKPRRSRKTCNTQFEISNIIHRRSGLGGKFFPEDRKHIRSRICQNKRTLEMIEAGNKYRRICTKYKYTENDHSTMKFDGIVFNKVKMSQNCWPKIS